MTHKENISKGTFRGARVRHFSENRRCELILDMFQMTHDRVPDADELEVFRVTEHADARAAAVLSLDLDVYSCRTEIGKGFRPGVTLVRVFPNHTQGSHFLVHVED